jgi:hypothetical protein
LKRRESGLWIAPNFGFLKMRARHRTVTLPSGERAKITVDDSGVVRQIEHGDQLDAIVRPHPIRLTLHVGRAAANAAHSARPRTIRTTAGIPWRRT